MKRDIAINSIAVDYLVDQFVAELTQNRAMQEEAMYDKINCILIHKLSQRSECCDIKYDSTLAKIIIHQMSFDSYKLRTVGAISYAFQDYLRSLVRKYIDSRHRQTRKNVVHGL